MSRPRGSDREAPIKVGIVSPYPVLPRLHGGRARIWGLAEGLARSGAEVAVLSPWAPGQPVVRSLGNGVVCQSHFLAANLLPAILPRTTASPLALLSLQPRSPWGPSRRLRAWDGFDIIQFEFCAQAGWMDLVPDGAKVVYDAHNVEFDFFQNAARHYRLRRWSARRIERLERHAVQRSDLVIACCEQDAERLGELYGRPARVAVVPHGHDPSLLDFDRLKLRQEARAALGIGPSERVLLFLGGDAWHNREAVEFLAERLLSQLDSSTRLLVVGTCGQELRGRRHRRVRATGFVDDMRPSLAAADVAVNPVSHGSGTNVKMFDYLAAGLPVVSTPVGIRGLPPLPSTVRVAPREAFAEVLREQSNGFPANGAALSDHTWDALGRRLFKQYERLLAGPSPTRPPRPGIAQLVCR